MLLNNLEAYFRPCETCMTELLAKIVNLFLAVNYF